MLSCYLTEAQCLCLQEYIKLNAICLTGETLDHRAGHGTEAEHKGDWH